MLELLVKNKLNQFYIYISFVPPSVKKIENKIDRTWDLKAEWRLRNTPIVLTYMEIALKRETAVKQDFNLTLNCQCLCLDHHWGWFWNHDDLYMKTGAPHLLHLFEHAPHVLRLSPYRQSKRESKLFSLTGPECPHSPDWLHHSELSLCLNGPLCIKFSVYALYMKGWCMFVAH